MSCLGGTHEDPREWYRMIDGELVPQVGRVLGCKVAGRDTRRKLCFGCPAFRGTDRDGVEQTGFLPDGSVLTLSAQEYEVYHHWVEEEFEPERFYAWLDGKSVWGLRHSDTIEWQEHWSAYMRSYRAGRGPTDEQRTARREYMRSYMRSYRERKRKPLSNEIAGRK